MKQSLSLIQEAILESIPDLGNCAWDRVIIPDQEDIPIRDLSDRIRSCAPGVLLGDICYMESQMNNLRNGINTGLGIVLSSV